jgi:RNA polymerase sigma-70 factor (ECF subfamily)
VSAELDAAIAAWPDVHVDRAAFLAHAARSGEAVKHASDLYLAFACAHGDQNALAALDAGYLRALRSPLGRMRLDGAAIDEILQALRNQQLVGDPPGILAYSGRGPLHAWLRSVAVRLALRERERGARGSPLLEERQADQGDDLELAYMKKQYGAAFGRAFDVALGELALDDRVLLKQRFRHGLGVVELGKLYGVNAGTISRRVAAARERLVAATRAHMSHELRLATGEVSSVLRMIESQIEVSLSVAERRLDEER